MKNELINKIRNIQDKETINKINLYVDTLTNINKKTINDIYNERINSNFYSEEQKQKLQIVYEKCLEQQQPYKDKIKKMKENDLIFRLIIDEVKEKVKINS